MVIPNFVKFTYSETSHSSYISIVFLRLPTISKPSKLEIVLKSHAKRKKKVGECQHEAVFSPPETRRVEGLARGIR